MNNLAEIFSDCHDAGDDVRPPCKATLNRNTLNDCDCNLAEALTAIRKEFAVELQRIGEEVIGPSPDSDPSNGRYNLWHEAQARLSQIVKEMGESK